MVFLIRVLLSFALFSAVAVAVPCLAEEIISACSIQQTENCTLDDYIAADLPAGIPSVETLLAMDDSGDSRHMTSDSAGTTEETIDDSAYLEEEEDEIPDPLEPLNRFVYFFNDKLYVIIIKPVANGYSAVLPEGVRKAVRNFFNNLTTPVRFVNNLLQLKIKSAGNELLRFGVNSTAGVLGLMDYAKNEMGIEMQDEDLGQTLGKLGIGPVFYLNLPVLGPSSLRDTAGLAGDYFLDPPNYVNPFKDRFAIKAGDKINRTSLVLGEYEKIKNEAFDPYIAFRDVYYQYRKKKIEE